MIVNYFNYYFASVGPNLLTKTKSNGSRILPEITNH